MLFIIIYILGVPTGFDNRLLDVGSTARFGGRGQSHQGRAEVRLYWELGLTRNSFLVRHS